MNKIALITGATSGIGEGCARRFARGGYNLIITGRNTGKLEILKKELEAEGTEVLALAFDVRNREAAKKAVDYIPDAWRNIDVLINNAGLARGLEPEYEGDFEDWDQMIDTNIKGLLTMTRLIVPGMIKRNHGHIINIGSVAGDAAYAGGNVYCATKAAVKAISDGLRIDVAHTKVRVTNVKPGLVETNFSNVRFHGDNARADQVYRGITPLNGDDVADVAYYAASAPEHVQIAEVLVLATHQANGTFWTLIIPMSMRSCSLPRQRSIPGLILRCRTGATSSVHTALSPLPEEECEAEAWRMSAKKCGHWQIRGTGKLWLPGFI